MCLPCFPWTWTQYEDPLDSMPEQSTWVHDGTAWSLQPAVSSLPLPLPLPLVLVDPLYSPSPSLGICEI